MYVVTLLPGLADLRGNARTEGALARYELSVNSALEDAEKSLTAYAKEQQRREILENTVSVAKDAMDIANEMYTKGLVTFLDVIQTRTTLFDAQDRLVQLLLARVDTSFDFGCEFLGGQLETVLQVHLG